MRNNTDKATDARLGSRSKSAVHTGGQAKETAAKTASCKPKDARGKGKKGQIHNADAGSNTDIKSAVKSKSVSDVAKKQALAKGDLVPVDIKNHKDSKGGHPHIIVDNIDDKHVSVGLSTHSKMGKNSTNYALEKDPLDSGKKSYVRRQGTVDKTDMYYGFRRGSMTAKDYSRAKIYGERAKQRYKDEKNKKK